MASARIAVQPFDHAASEGAGLGLGARQPAIELGDAGALVEEACQSSADQPSSAGRSSATMSALWRDSSSSTAAGGGADASSTRSSPSIRDADAGGACRLQGFGRAHSRALQPGAPFFPAQIGAGDLRPHRPQRSQHWFSTGWRGRSERCHCRYRPHRALPSARSDAAKPLAGLDFGMGADDADGADGRAPGFSGAEKAGSW